MASLVLVLEAEFSNCQYKIETVTSWDLGKSIKANAFRALVGLYVRGKQNSYFLWHFFSNGTLGLGDPNLTSRKTYISGIYRGWREGNEGKI